MKQYYFSILLTIGFYSCLNAQTFVCSPSNTLNGSAPFNSYTDFNIDMVNQNSDTLELAWDLLINTIDEDWDYSVCDYTACYTMLPQSGIMAANYSTSPSFLKVTVNPQKASGTGVLQFWVYDLNDTTSGDTVTFNISTQAIGLAEESIADISIYPNPAKDYFNIGPDVKEIEIYNSTGSLLSSQKINFEDQKILLNSIPAGLCYVRMKLKNGNVVTTGLMVEK